AGVRAPRKRCSAREAVRKRHPAAASWPKDGSAFNAATREVRQRTVGIFDRKGHHVRTDWVRRSKREERPAIVSRQIGDGPQDPLLPEQPVRKRRDVAHMNAGAHDHTARYDTAERLWNEPPHRREDDR